MTQQSRQLPAFRRFSTIHETPFANTGLILHATQDVTLGHIFCVEHMKRQDDGGPPVDHLVDCNNHL